MVGRQVAILPPYQSIAWYDGFTCSSQDYRILYLALDFLIISAGASSAEFHRRMAQLEKLATDWYISRDKGTPVLHLRI